MAVTNPYYEFAPAFIPGTKARSDEVNTQYQAIQNAFDLLPSSEDAITTGTATFAPESGAGNAYVVTMPNTRTSNQDGDQIVFFATHSNTGAATIDVDGIGAVALVDWDGTALIGGEIVNGRLYNVRYDATNAQFVLEASADASLQKVYAKEWANNPVGTLVSAAAGGDQVDDYSAFHQATAAEAWAIRAEDDPVPTLLGGDGVSTFSAYHWAQKASGASGVPIGTITNSVMRYELGTGWVEETDFRITTGGAILQVDADAAAIETFAFPAIVPGGTPVTDPDLGNVILLVSFEGQTATRPDPFAPDIGSAGNITYYTRTGAGDFMEIRSDQAIFGDRALYISGATGATSGCYMYSDMVTDTDWHFGTGDFTMEAHFFPVDAQFNSFPILGNRNFTGQNVFNWFLDASFRMDGVIGNSFTGFNQIPTGITTGSWYHLVFQRRGTQLEGFVDGTRIASVNIGTTAVPVPTVSSYRTMVHIGGEDADVGDSEYYLDNIRVTRGVARYQTASFTPPAAPYDGSIALNTLYVGDPAYDTQIDGSNIFASGPTTINNTLAVTGATTLAGVTTGDITATRVILPLENDPLTPELAFGDADSGFYESLDDVINVSIAGASRFYWTGDQFLGNNANSGALFNEIAGSTNPTLIPNQSDANTGVGWRSVDVLTLVAGGEARFEALGTGVTRVVSPGTLGTDPANLQFVTSGVASKGHVGFFSSGDLELRNSQISNRVVIQGTNAGSTLNTMGRFDPDGECSLWYDGLPRTGTNSTGRLNVYSDGNTDAEQRTINFAHQDGTVRSSIGNVTSTEFILRNLIHGGPVQITAEDDAGVTRTILDADPDSTTILRADTSIILQVAAGETAIIANDNSSVDLYYDNQLRFNTLTSGSAQIRRGSTTDTDQCRLGFANSNGVDRAWVGFGVQGNSRVELNSEVHGGALFITGETAGGSAQNLFSATPGANDTIVYSNGVSELVVGTTKITANTLFLNERSAAIADVAGDGQLWVLSDSPNILMFTDDSGQDYAVAMNGGYVNDNVNVNNSWNFNTAGNRSANFVSYHGDGGNDTITLGNSTGTGLTNFPIYDSINIIAPGSGVITIAEGTGTTLFFDDGSDTVGGCTISGGVATIFRASATDYIIWGSGLT